MNEDTKIIIATGSQRNSKQWKNKEVNWANLVNKLSKTHRTAETHAEYLAASKDRQDEIKDVGGFVGGTVIGGRRKKGSVPARQLLTLDLDFAPLDFWDDFTMIYGYEAALYSTHKHCPANPRYRLVIPLSREVQPEEYEAIARRLAGNLGIELFDPTTFQVERLMYWPSTAKDGEYVFQYQTGKWLDPDKLLNEYEDWTDTSQWPRSIKDEKRIKKSIAAKQQDPATKDNLVGDFCRTYSIHDAIEKFLPDVYEPTEDKDRYTYTGGSTSGGLVVYEDGKFAYSHHSTDPASGITCNAFDLVRLHKFGLMDEDAKPDTPTNKLPSYVAMLDFARQDAETKKQIARRKIEEVAEDFAEGISVEEATDWMKDLESDRKNNYSTNHKNIGIVLANDPNFKNKIGFDEFTRRTKVLAALPWDKPNTIFPREWQDDDRLRLINYLCTPPLNFLSGSKLEDVLAHIKHINSIHPVRAYLTALVWDGKKRLERLFIDLLGAENSLYTRTVTRKALVACIARIFTPGCKFDYILVLVGPEGKMKSTILRKLGGLWFSDSFNFGMIHSKTAYEQIQGFWIIEIAELAGLKKADVEAAKSFITSTSDNYRAAYGRETNSRPRQCVFFATTNNQDFLKNEYGNRRYWPVPIAVTDAYKSVSNLSQKEIGQIWAEAKHYFDEGETLYLPEELETEARNRQTAHTELDERAGMVQEYLETLLPDNWEELDIDSRRLYFGDFENESGEGIEQRNTVCAAEIWCECFRKNKSDLNTREARTIHSILRMMPEWKLSKNKKRMGPYGTNIIYERIKKSNKKRVADVGI